MKWVARAVRLPAGIVILAMMAVVFLFWGVLTGVLIDYRKSFFEEFDEVFEWMWNGESS
jgi:hypothetical protein